MQALPRLALVALLLVEPAEREQAGRALRLLGDGALVGRDRQVGLTVEFVNPGQREQCAVSTAARVGAALFELADQRVELAVALAVELSQALQRKIGAGLGERHAEVASDQRFAARPWRARLTRVGRPWLG